MEDFLSLRIHNFDADMTAKAETGISSCYVIIKSAQGRDVLTLSCRRQETAEAIAKAINEDSLGESYHDLQRQQETVVEDDEIPF